MPRLKHTPHHSDQRTWFAVKEKHQLQAKLENLEQVLKVGHCFPPGSWGKEGPENSKAESGWNSFEFFKIIKICGLYGAVFTLLSVVYKAINNKKFECFWEGSCKTNYAFYLEC